MAKHFDAQIEYIKMHQEGALLFLDATPRNYSSFIPQQHTGSQKKKKSSYAVIYSVTNFKPSSCSQTYRKKWGS